MNDRMKRRLGIEIESINKPKNKDTLFVTDGDNYRVKQIYVSPAVSFFKQKLLKKYNLVSYNNKNVPAIFNGLYGDINYVDMKTLKNHKSNKIVVWCGTDSKGLINMPNKIEQLKKMKNIRHIAKSKYVYESLKRCGIDSEIIPVTPTNIIKNREDRGECIYVYVAKNNKKNVNKYGEDLVKQIKNKTKIKIIDAHFGKYTKEQLNNIYKQCFLGLRLTKHDGLPNTVIELGLMGRMCVYNGELPNAIPYNSVDDIIKIINEEYEKRYENNQHIVDDMFNYLNIDDNWMII